MTNIAKRSYAKIIKPDLRKLLDHARKDREDLFDRIPRWKRLYSKRVICTALCQGAALHYVGGKNGVKDFDVWTFYAAHKEAPFPYRRNGSRDFGKSKFGVHPSDTGKFVGRCVDLLGRSLPCSPKADPVKSVIDYLENPRSKSAYELSKKAVVMLEPEGLLGKIIWTP